MSTITEIEAAIERLGNLELAELRSWLERYARQRGEAPEDRRIAAIRATSGCLSHEDAEDFARAVAEAGRDMPDAPHEW